MHIKGDNSVFKLSTRIQNEVKAEELTAYLAEAGYNATITITDVHLVSSTTF